MSKGDKIFVITLISILIIGIIGVWSFIFARQYTALEVAEPESPASPEIPAPVESKVSYSVPPIVAPKNPSSSSKSTTKDGEVIISKPEPPPPPKVEDEEQLTDPTKKPEYPSSSAPSEKPKKDDNIKLDEKGNQIPNEKGEIFVPGFGWMKPTGGRTEYIDTELSGELIGY